MTMIAGGGFARMAAELASRRAEASGEWSICTVESGGPVLREDIGCRDDYPASFEYYRIIDKATAAWPAFAGERSIGICPRIGL